MLELKGNLIKFLNGNKSIVQHSLKDDEFSLCIGEGNARLCCDNKLILKFQGLNTAGVYFSLTFLVHSGSVRGSAPHGHSGSRMMEALPSYSSAILSHHGKRREGHGELTPALL